MVQSVSQWLCEERIVEVLSRCLLIGLRNRLLLTSTCSLLRLDQLVHAWQIEIEVPVTHVLTHRINLVTLIASEVELEVELHAF